MKNRYEKKLKEITDILEFYKDWHLPETKEYKNLVKAKKRLEFKLKRLGA